MTALGLRKPAVRLLALVGIAALLSFLAVASWQASKSSNNSCPFMVPGSVLSTGRSFNSYVDRGECVRLGRASTPQELAQGLSGREFMPKDEGLLFIFNNPGQQCMWMKDMRFNLDMIWLNETKTISHIESNLSPQTYPESYCGNGNASYVIEVNSGVAKAAHLKVGDKLNF